MIFDAINQNRAFTEAAQRAKDTSPRIDKAKEASKKISKGEGAEDVALTKGESNLNKSRKRIASSSVQLKSIGRPSYEGLMYSSSAEISMNDSGYLNQKIQKSRYGQNKIQEFVNQKDAMFSSVKSLNSGIMGAKSSMLNYTNRSASGSSSERILMINRINNTF
jgi:hypothetical protein